MREFDFYEFAGVVVPGSVLLVGSAVCVPAIKAVVFEKDLSLGESALALVVAYGLGHLIQAVGNAIEKLWWRAWKGMPSDWPRSGQHRLLAEQQVAVIDDALFDRLGYRVEGGFRRLDQQGWYALVRQIYAFVMKAGTAKRIDVFNGNYGLNRGMAAALLSILFIHWATADHVRPGTVLLILAAAGLALYRMHRFGVHYARELFVQFLTSRQDQKD